MPTEGVPSFAVIAGFLQRGRGGNYEIATSASGLLAMTAEELWLRHHTALREA